eukprot:scaffold1452_cov64-Phaeocystis_antarctica.AAC.4
MASSAAVLLLTYLLTTHLGRVEIAASVDCSPRPIRGRRGRQRRRGARPAATAPPAPPAAPPPHRGPAGPPGGWGGSVRGRARGKVCVAMCVVQQPTSVTSGVPLYYHGCYY